MSGKPPKDDLPVYVAPAEVCSRLGVSERTLKRWADGKMIEYISLPSGHRRYNLAAFLKTKQEK